MSEDRTLPASSRRRAEAIAQGGLPRSGGLTSAIVVLAAATYVVTAGADVMADAAGWLGARLATASNVAATPVELGDQLRSSFWAGVRLAGGIVLIGFAAAAAADVVQSGLRLSTASLGPQFGRRWGRFLGGASPWRMVSEGARWIVAVAVLVAVVLSRWSQIRGLVRESPTEWPELGGALLSDLALRLGGLLLAVGIVQYAWARWTWERSLQMTPEEQREEQRIEGKSPKRTTPRRRRAEA